MPLALVALLALVQNREDTLGKTNAQILAMGRKGWYGFYTGKQGESTAAMAGAEGLYADALARRNDRLLKGRKSPLRESMRAFSNDAQTVGYAITGGGTMWNITAASLYADEEEALCRVLTHSGRGPRRVVSDVERAVARLTKGLEGAEESPSLNEGRAAATQLPGDLRAVVGQARRLPRRDSDTVLEFCRGVAAGVAEQATAK